MRPAAGVFALPKCQFFKAFGYIFNFFMRGSCKTQVKRRRLENSALAIIPKKFSFKITDMSAIAILDIKLQVTVSPQGVVTKKNVLYKIKNPDGSIDQVERSIGRLFLEKRWNQRGKVILEAPSPALLPILKTNITRCENVGNKLVTNIGALILKERLQAPTPKPPTITEQLKTSLTEQKAEIEVLKQQIAALEAQVQQEINDIAMNSEAIANIERSVRRLNELLDV